MNIRANWALVVCCLVGCAGTQPPVAPSPPGQQSVAPAAPLNTAQSSPTANPSPAVVAAPAPSPSPFHIVAIGVSLFPTDGGLMFFNGEDMLAEIEGDTVTPHPEYLGTYTPEIMSNLEVVGGHWPKHGLISVSRPAARSSYSTLYEKNGKGWRQLATTSAGEWYAGVQPWSGGRTLALVLSMGYGYRWDVVHGPRGSLPKPTLLSPEARTYSFNLARVRAIAFSALPNGELFAIGADQTQENTWAVERWAPGAQKSVIDRLPGDTDGSVEYSGIVALSASDAYAYGSIHERKDAQSFKYQAAGGCLAHFDGKAWSLVPFAGKHEITSLAIGANALWVASGTLYKQALGSTNWERVPLPAEDQLRDALVVSKPYLNQRPFRLAIKQVYVGKDSTIWLDGLTDIGGARFVMRTRPFPAIWHAPNDSNWTRSVHQFQPYRAADESCEGTGSHIFVMLYAATKSTPKNYDYPLTRAALKGHTEFEGAVFAETEDLGRHYFGAFIPDFALAKKLVTLVEEGVKGSKPVALCRDPKKVRILSIDLKTGNVTSNTLAPPEPD